MCPGQARDQFATVKSISCVNETKDDCKKHKCQLKMMEDEQNLWKNTVKGTQAKTSKKKKNVGKPQAQARKMYQNTLVYSYSIEATQIPNSNIK